ncbi:hypothetical protein CHS0354_026215 [Potamilus streckersoni]|uniref:Zinc transporter ZIP1 n=1 Tax=Potamilus streckersoni TaxID=2493646 RepID=A0AAE0SMW1_9BIVA|nr:hypothetical protein CHS0354_026215 [Potamilus streckersoni]
MELKIIKVLVLISLFILTFFLGSVPLLVSRIFQNRATTIHQKTIYKRTLSFLSCFAAGVFLATCFLDLLPDVRENLILVLNKMNILTSFPIAEFVAMFGLFLILIVEQIVLTVKERQLEYSVMQNPLLACESDRIIPNQNKSFTRFVSEEHSIKAISDEVNRSSPLSESYRKTEDTSGLLTGDTYNMNDDDGFAHEDHMLSAHESEHSHSFLRSVMLLLAISLHSVFEGLAVGLQQKTEGVIDIFAALLLHKGILSFSLGMSLIQSKLSKTGVIRSILLFSSTSPVGIAIGMGIVTLSSSQTSILIQGILTGIACGTFLYVTFFEMLPDEFNSSDQRLLKVVCLLFGFGTVTSILFLHSEPHAACYILPK